jgi:hypothetical protein
MTLAKVLKRTLRPSVSAKIKISTIPARLWSNITASPAWTHPESGDIAISIKARPGGYVGTRPSK